MADDKSNRGPADRARINVNEDYEVAYWAKELGVGADRLEELVVKHGVMAADVRKALGKHQLGEIFHAIQK
jgi:uncharacterized protein DUF3606